MLICYVEFPLHWQYALHQVEKKLGKCNCVHARSGIHVHKARRIHRFCPEYELMPPFRQGLSPSNVPLVLELIKPSKYQVIG